MMNEKLTKPKKTCLWSVNCRSLTLLAFFSPTGLSKYVFCALTCAKTLRTCSALDSVGFSSLSIFIPLRISLKVSKHSNKLATLVKLLLTLNEHCPHQGLTVSLRVLTQFVWCCHLETLPLLWQHQQLVVLQIRQLLRFYISM